MFRDIIAADLLCSLFFLRMFFLGGHLCLTLVSSSDNMFWLVMLHCYIAKQVKNKADWGISSKLLAFLVRSKTIFTCETVQRWHCWKFYWLLALCELQSRPAVQRGSLAPLCLLQTQLAQLLNACWFCLCCGPTDLLPDWHGTVHHTKDVACVACTGCMYVKQQIEHDVSCPGFETL